jgi:hypothetical protein
MKIIGVPGGEYSATPFLDYAKEKCMSEYNVPEDGLNAAHSEGCGCKNCKAEREAAVKLFIRWQSENLGELFAKKLERMRTPSDAYRVSIKEFNAIAESLYRAPEPEASLGIADLLVDYIGDVPMYECSRERFNSAIIEAFRRGQKAGGRQSR